MAKRKQSVSLKYLKKHNSYDEVVITLHTVEDADSDMVNKTVRMPVVNDSEYFSKMSDVYLQSLQELFNEYIFTEEVEKNA